MVGNWNGVGNTAKAGVFRKAPTNGVCCAGLWVLEYNGNGAWDGPVTDRAFLLGQGGDDPVIGDWNGSGTAKAGIFRAGLWVLDFNGNGVWDGPPADRAFNLASGSPVVGAWAAAVPGPYNGVDGCTIGPCVNAVPCRHCTGSWQDNSGNTWNITSSLADNTVSGSVTVPVPGGCPSITYQVSGSITPVGAAYYGARGYTQFTLHATNGSPSTPCNGLGPRNGTATGTISNDGCDIGGGTYRNDDGSASGAFSMAKMPDLPTGESTQPVGWWASDPTVQLFRQTLQGDSFRPFDGRQVTESPGPDVSDGCYFNNSAYPFRVTGGAWVVGRYAFPPYYFSSNQWIDDYVGFGADGVSYYRINGRAPCNSNAQQIMNIYTNGNTGMYRQYTSGYIGAGIDVSTISVSRNNQIVSKEY